MSQVLHASQCVPLIINGICRSSIMLPIPCRIMASAVLPGSIACATCCSQMAIRHNGVWLMPTAEADGNVPFALPATCSKLRLSFPHKVDSERGTAKWDNKKKTLTVTLPIIRDDPFA
jgi:hypothetical protein